MSERLLFPCCVFFLCLSCLHVLSHFYMFSVLNFNSHVVENAEHYTQCAPVEWGVLPCGDFQPLSEVMSPTSSTTSTTQRFSAAIFQNESVDIDTELSYSCDAELDDELNGKALSSPLFIHQRGEPANLRQTFPSHEESLLLARTSTGRPVNEPSSDLSQKRKAIRDLKNDRMRILLEQILAEVRSEIQKQELQAESVKKKCPGINWNSWFSANGNWSYYHRVWPSQARTITTSRRTIRTKSFSSWNSYQEYARHGRNAEKSRVKGRGIFKNKIDWRPEHDHGPRAKIQELQSDVNCKNDSSDFKDAESVRSGPSHVPSQPAYFHLIVIKGGLLSRNNQPPDIWNSQGTSGNVFANPRASSSSLYPGGFNPWISNVTEDTPVLTSREPVTCGERQIPDTVLTPRFQLRPSVGNSFDPKEGSHFDKIPTQQHLLAGR